MIINLTSVCNKNCSFCFAKFMEKGNTKYMPLDLLEKTLSSILSSKYPFQIIAIEGGEPTLHPDFEKVLALFRKYKLKLKLHSNFLFSSEVSEIINKNLDIIPIISINASELDESTIDLFIRNYNNLDKSNIEYFLGIILNKTTSFEDFKNYFNFLSNYIKNIPKIKIIQELPGENDMSAFDFLSTSLGDKYFEIFKFLITQKIDMFFDYNLFPCQFENKNIFSILNKFAMPTQCDEAPMALLPNGMMSYCPATSTRILINSISYSSIDRVQDELTHKKRLIEKKLIPNEKCKNCDIFGKECKGPCIAFYSY